MSSRAHVFVTGLVQGVFFRASTKHKARELGLRGWVKNLPDGRVEAVFEGEKEAVGKIVQWCVHGPESAEVKDLDVKWEEPEGLGSFEILY